MVDTEDYEPVRGIGVKRQREESDDEGGLSELKQMVINAKTMAKELFDLTLADITTKVEIKKTAKSVFLTLSKMEKKQIKRVLVRKG